MTAAMSDASMSDLCWWRTTSFESLGHTRLANKTVSILSATVRRVIFSRTYLRSWLLVASNAPTLTDGSKLRSSTSEIAGTQSDLSRVRAGPCSMRHSLMIGRNQVELVDESHLQVRNRLKHRVFTCSGSLDDLLTWPIPAWQQMGQMMITFANCSLSNTFAGAHQCQTSLHIQFLCGFGGVDLVQQTATYLLLTGRVSQAACL